MELQVFKNAGFEIRGALIDDEPVFVAADVCSALGLSNTSQTVSRLDEDEKGITPIYTLGGMQELLTVNESGLYSLIFRSIKKEAIQFRKWVTSEVLPTIRKTGKYESKPLPIGEQIQLIAQGYGELQEDIKELKATMRVQPWQKRILKQTHDEKVYQLLGDENDPGKVRKMHSRIWSVFKKRFGLAVYDELPACKYAEGVAFLNGLKVGDLL